MGIKLGNICRFQSGGTPAKGRPEFFNGTIPWITTTALNGGNIGKESAVDWICEQAIKESAAKIVPAFSIMVGTRVGVGKVAINTIWSRLSLKSWKNYWTAICQNLLIRKKRIF